MYKFHLVDPSCRYQLKPIVETHYDLPPHGIGDGVAEHVEEGGLEEGVELGEGLAALGPQGVRRIQNPRNPLLLGEGREGDWERGKEIFAARLR